MRGFMELFGCLSRLFVGFCSAGPRSAGLRNFAALCLSPGMGQAWEQELGFLGWPNPQRLRWELDEGAGYMGVGGIPVSYSQLHSNSGVNSERARLQTGG